PWVPVRVATNCTGWPKTDGVTVEVTALVGAICPTDWLRRSEVLAVEFGVPWYVAVTGWTPTLRVEVTSESATPLPRVAGLPKADPLTKNCTVPVGGSRLGARGATVAVKLTGCPSDEGLTDEVTVVVVPAAPTVCVTVPVLAAKFGSPLSCAVIVRSPTASPANGDDVAIPPLRPTGSPRLTLS